MRIQWIRNNASTLLSQIVDNLVFSFIAFLGSISNRYTNQYNIINIFFKDNNFNNRYTICIYLATYLKRKDKIREI